MIYTSIRHIRVACIWIGFVAILSSFFLPFYSGCRWNSDQSGTINFIKYGYEVYPCYYVPVLVLSIFFSGYFWRRLINKILLYVFTCFLLIFLFLIWRAPSWGANPCINNDEIGQDLSVYGSLLVSIGTFISVYREQE